jgi:hypothetical protein
MRIKARRHNSTLAIGGVSSPAGSDLQSESYTKRICNPLLTFQFHKINLFNGN